MSVIEKFHKVEIIYTKGQGRKYTFKLDGMEIRGIQGFKIEQHSKDCPFPLIELTILPRELHEIIENREEKT